MAVDEGATIQSEREKDEDVKVLLVQMPWAIPESPSIALGILKSICSNEGVECGVIYPNMLFGESRFFPVKVAVALVQ